MKTLKKAPKTKTKARKSSRKSARKFLKSVLTITPVPVKNQDESSRQFIIEHHIGKSCHTFTPGEIRDLLGLPAPKLAVIKCPPLKEVGGQYIGKTIEEIRKMLKEKLELSEIHPVQLSKDGGNTYGAVGEKYHVNYGDLVEFSRPAREKCSITKCTGCGKEHCLEHGDCV